MAHIWMINPSDNAKQQKPRLNCLLRVNILSERLRVQTFHCLTPLMWLTQLTVSHKDCKKATDSIGQGKKTLLADSISEGWKGFGGGGRFLTVSHVWWRRVTTELLILFWFLPHLQIQKFSFVITFDLIPISQRILLCTAVGLKMDQDCLTHVYGLIIQHDVSHHSLIPWLKHAQGRHLNRPKWWFYGSIFSPQFVWDVVLKQRTNGTKYLVKQSTACSGVNGWLANRMSPWLKKWQMCVCFGLNGSNRNVSKVE